MSDRISEQEARRVYQEMVADELEWLLRDPEMMVYPHPFGSSKRVRNCDRSSLEALARRNVERAIEQNLRSKDSVTQG